MKNKEFNNANKFVCYNNINHNFTLKCLERMKVIFYKLEFKYIKM